MFRSSSTLTFLTVLSTLISPATAQNHAPREFVDLNAIYKIKSAEFGSAAGKPKSNIADLIWTLTDRFGPRLTNSPQFRRAAEWAAQQLRDWGISNVHQEKWPAPPNKPLPGWECTYFNLSMVEPTYQQLIAVPDAWTPATNGAVTAEAVVPDGPRTIKELETMRGKYTGKILVYGGSVSQLPIPQTPLALRYTAEQLATFSTERIRVLNPFPRRERPDTEELSDKQIIAFWAQERPLALLRSGRKPGQDGDSFQGGTVWGGPVTLGDFPKPPPTAILAPEHYNRIARLLDRNVPVKVQLEIKTVIDESLKSESFNIIGEIPGGAKKDEIVMLGAHLDSWSWATGATDNAIGAAVVMEVMRILRQVNVVMDRTVRVALWSGEEQVLLGSRAYVKEHFADRADMRPKPEHEKLSAYFDLDNGTGKIQGISLWHNDMARPIFEDWFAALKDLTHGAVLPRSEDEDRPGVWNDHMAFDEVGLPGFRFLQDPLDLETRTHHTNMDTFDRIQLEDAEQMAVVVASFVYNAAQRSDKLPRKLSPAPQPHK